VYAPTSDPKAAIQVLESINPTLNLINSNQYETNLRQYEINLDKERLAVLEEKLQKTEQETKLRARRMLCWSEVICPESNASSV
jgi:hypothetical protein